MVLATRFPGAVLVPPVGLEPFAGLNEPRIDAAALDSCCPLPRRYTLEFGDQAAAARLSGTGGSDVFDSARAAQPTPGGWNTEIFGGLWVRQASPAIVLHGGRHWSVAWYDATQDMSYQLDLTGALAAPDEGQTPQQLVETASKLAILK